MMLPMPATSLRNLHAQPARRTAELVLVVLAVLSVLTVSQPLISIVLPLSTSCLAGALCRLMCNIVVALTTAKQIEAQSRSVGKVSRRPASAVCHITAHIYCRALIVKTTQSMHKINRDSGRMALTRGASSRRSKALGRRRKGSIRATTWSACNIPEARIERHYSEA